MSRKLELDALLAAKAWVFVVMAREYTDGASGEIGRISAEENSREEKEGRLMRLCA